MINLDKLSTLINIILGITSILISIVGWRLSEKGNELSFKANELANSSKDIGQIANHISELSAPLIVKIEDFEIVNVKNKSVEEPDDVQKGEHYQLNLGLSGGLSVKHGTIDTLYIVTFRNDKLEFNNIENDSGFINNDGMSVSLNNISASVPPLSSKQKNADVVFYIVIVDKNFKIAIFAVLLQAEGFVKKHVSLDGNQINSYTTFNIARTLKMKQQINRFVIYSDKYLLSNNYKEFAAFRGKDYVRANGIGKDEMLHDMSTIRNFLRNNL